MINRKNRFHGHNSLNHMYRHGKTVRSESLSLKYCDNNREDYRLAVIVSKKVSKSAVKRNRIRRRIYEVVRIIKKNNSKLAWRYDIALTVFDVQLANIPSEQLNLQIEQLLKKAKILK